MLRRLALVLAAVLLLVVGAAAVMLVNAHLAVRREAAPLPTLDAISAVAGVGILVDDAPVRLSVINTASQAMPRAAVLDPDRDPHPDDPYVMSHPSFVLEWKDGRLLLVDVGMTREGARAFGRPLEWLGGAQPMDPHGSAAAALGNAARRVKGIVFTHLHTDHVGGIGELCTSLNTLRVPMTDWRQSSTPRQVRSRRCLRQLNQRARSRTPTASTSSASPEGRSWPCRDSPVSSSSTPADTRPAARSSSPSSRTAA